MQLLEEKFEYVGYGLPLMETLVYRRRNERRERRQPIQGRTWIIHTYLPLVVLCHQIALKNDRNDYGVTTDTYANVLFKIVG